jgi:hypothetical protein
MKKVRNALAVAAVLACVGTPAAMAEVKTGPQAQDQLSAQYPGVRYHKDQGRTRIIYGKKMTTGNSPRQAAERWLNDHVLAFGAGQLDLDETVATDVKFGEFFVFHYKQTMQGLPVDSSLGRVLVRNNDDGTWSVVYAAGLFVGAPEGGFATMTRTGQDAVNFIKGSEYGRLPVWSNPELVVFQRQTETGFEAVRAWQFVGENPDLVRREKFTFFVDASTGALLEARDEVHNIDVFGRVDGFGTPGNLPDMASNPPVLLNVNDIRVAISGGNTDFTDTDGTLTRQLEDIVYRYTAGSGELFDGIATANAKADSALLDTHLDIFDSEGNLITDDSQTGRLTNAFAVYASEADATYFVRVRSDEFEPGRPFADDFTLQIDAAGLDIPLDPVSRVGFQRFNGNPNFNIGGDAGTEMYTFQAQASGNAIISAQGDGDFFVIFPQGDPSMTLYDADGNFIAFSDRFFGNSPQIEASLVGGERYFMVIDAFDRATNGGVSVLVEANHTFDEGADPIDDHANSLDYANATPLVWSDWGVATDNTTGFGPIPDHSLVSLATGSGRIHRGADTDLFVFVPPVDMLGGYVGNIGAEIDEDMDGESDRDGDAAQDEAIIPWYETYRPSTRVEIQVQPVEDPGAPSFTWLTPTVRVYDSLGMLVYDNVPDTIIDSPPLINFAGSLDPARYYADLDPAINIDYAGGAEPFDGVFSLEVWGGEPYYVEIGGTSGSGLYNMWVSADGMPDPSDDTNWSNINSRNPLNAAGEEFAGIADDTGTYTVSGIVETPNNFNNAAIDFANAQTVSLGVANGGFAGPTGTPNNFLDGSSGFERAFTAGDADFASFWTFPNSIADGVGATLLAGYDSTGMVLGDFDNTGVAILQESGLAGIEHPLDNDIYTFRATGTGFAEVRINTTQLNDFFSEWIADGEGVLVDSTADDVGFFLNDDNEVEGEFVTPVNNTKTKTYNSILDSALRIFDNDFEQVGYNSSNNAMLGETETTYMGPNGERTFHKRDARVTFPIVKGEIYYVQVESGQADQYQAWQTDSTIPVNWQHMIGSYEMLINTIPTINNDDHSNASRTGATTIGIDETTGTGSIAGTIDNNVTNPFDADLFAFTAPASGDVSITVARANGSTLIPAATVFAVNRLAADNYEVVQRDTDTATSGGSLTIDLNVTKGERYLVQVIGAGSTEGDYTVELSGLADVDDHADWLEFQGATEIPLLDFLGSAEADGSIEGNGDTDLFKFEVGDFTDATVTVSGENGFNPYLEIFEVSVDPSGNPVMLKIDYNDDVVPDENTDAQIVVGLTPGRISGITGDEYPYYYALVRGSDIQADEGDYTVAFNITKTDDHPDAGQFSYATPIAVDNENGQGQDTGIIEIEGDTDLFRITALAGGTARVTVSRPGGSTFLPKLSILDIDGNELDTPSDGALPGIVQTSVVRGQVYYVLIEASSLATGDQLTGDYTVTVVEPPLDDYPNALEWSIAHSLTFDRDTGDAILGTQEMGNPLNPQLEVVSDTDLFTFSTIATGNVAISFDPLEDSIIGIRPELSVYDSTFTLIQTVMASGPGETVAVVLTDTNPNERYYVLVSDVIGNRTGEYQLIVDGASSDGGGGGGGNGDLDFDNATEIALDPIRANGAVNGIIAQAGERDLFTFNAPAGGDIYVQIITARGSLIDATVTILDAESETAVVTDDATGIPGVDAAVRFQSAGANTQYWVVVDGIGTGVGSYTIKIDAEPEVFRIFYPAGFTGPNINEFVSIANPNSFDVTYSVILRYETGDRDQTIVSNATIAAGSRGGVTISVAGSESPVGARIAPYAIEVQAVGGPLGAAMGHFDFGSTTGDAFTDVISPAWSLARIERSSGNVNDFILYYNPHDFDVNVTLNAYNAAGNPVEINTTVGALRRGGLNIDQVSALPVGIFGATVTAEPVDSANAGDFQGIVVGQSHFDLVNESGFGLIGDPIGGSLKGAVPSLIESDAADSELVLFNPNPFTATVQIRGEYVRAPLPDLARNVSIPAGGTLRLTGSDLGMIDSQPLGITYTANYPITVLGSQTQFGDADASTGASQAGTGWFFGAAFINSALAGESYFETLGIYNPADTTAQVSVELFFLDGSAETLVINVGANGFAEVRLHETLGSDFQSGTNRPADFDPNAVLGRPGLNFFSLFASSDSPIAVSFTHYDLFLQGGWTNSGAALGLLNPISQIV